MSTPVVSTPVVLVVEDDTLIRMDAVAMIEDGGYEVIEAIGADEAVILLETRSDIRVVFTDIEMPGSMDGLKLVHAIRQRWPPIVLIVASGRPQPAPADMPQDTVFLQKPYRAAQILEVLAGIK
ncbi:response regulator [Bosea sp. 685]|uniref:response regulator n=1 Tax=Bosea sp. 685 TaxID=3080057 RepID=UPI002892A306|nr:response regulator [Bosea sp. 685]WNJ89066.1 response regulator [Bosea sp. 685]